MSKTNFQGSKIAVLYGGPGSERKVSLASGAGVASALRTLGAEVIEVDVQDGNFELPSGIEIAFNAIHGTFGEDGQVQSILESRGVPYTGEGVAGSQLCIDKIATKRRLVERGVPTPKFEVLQGETAPSMAPPFVVKAPREGSSVGVYIVQSAAELENALVEARRLSPELLVEEFVAGRELTVGVVGERALPVIEIRAKKDFYNFENKYPFLNPQAAGADHYCPAPLDAELTKKVQELALSAQRALDLEVYSRVDILLSEAGVPLVIEVNTIPGMTPSSLLPEAAAAEGVSYPELCAQIIDLSLAARRRSS
jgi:D-alanine-D-alanine ligase